jgi:aminocarboxymuconate-semialdehyde decarboxylase
MLFTCPNAAARGGGPASYRGGRRDLCVDIHCHVHVPAADEMVKHLVSPDREPAGRFSNALSRETNRKQMENVRDCLTSVETRLRDMDKMGMDVQAISPSPFHFMYWLPGDVAIKMSRTVNEHLAGIVKAHPDRFVALAHVPLQRRTRRRPSSSTA